MCQWEYILETFMNNHRTWNDRQSQRSMIGKNYWQKVLDCQSPWSGTLGTLCQALNHGLSITVTWMVFTELYWYCTDPHNLRGSINCVLSQWEAAVKSETAHIIWPVEPVDPRAQWLALASRGLHNHWLPTTQGLPSKGAWVMTQALAGKGL